MTCFKLLKWKLKCDETNKLFDLQARINRLIEESDGVIGLHLNGDIADWDWLIDNDWLPADIKDHIRSKRPMAWRKI